LCAKCQRWSDRFAILAPVGSFTEVVLSFSFRPDTPEEVLAAFSGLAVPRPVEHHSGPEPGLPAPFDDPDDRWLWEPTNELTDPAADPEPWKHDWAGWTSQSMSVAYTPSAQMMWSDLELWTVSCRWGIKSWPMAELPALQWLGPFLDRYKTAPKLMGYMQYDNDDRPVLVWLQPDGRITGEDLNPESHYD
jgi:hypothetical protein